METITQNDTLTEPLGPTGFGGNRTAKGVAWTFTQTTEFQVIVHAVARDADYQGYVHGVRLCLPVWNVR